MNPHNQTIVQINTSDTGGGAEKVAFDLFKAYQRRGYNSYLAVGRKTTNDPYVVPFENGYFDFLLKLKKEQILSKESFFLVSKGLYQISRQLINQPLRMLGQELLYYPGIWRLFSMNGIRPDIIHCHNLHGGYFDLKALPQLSLEYPLVITLHDAWLMSGHCAHSFSCEKWKTGCGKCPDLTIPPALPRDGTAKNWSIKRSIFRKSSFTLVTPCNWLMDKVEQSIVNEGVSLKAVISNGVDQTIFHPGDRSIVRRELGLPEDAIIILFAAHGIRANIWKDYQTLHRVITYISRQKIPKKIIFIALGESSPSEKLLDIEIRFIPHTKDPKIVAKYYQASDIYLHPARAETFPLTIIEALSCGIPVIASAVGGIPEQVEEGISGFLTPVGSAEPMVERIIQVIQDDNLREKLGGNAEKRAKEKFSLVTQTTQYIKLYQELKR